ncbi:MAG: TfoX/Sxy family protein [Nitrospirota bacterium]|nr:TfoX/Sxy family protein [Nitrospirota bacterium]
MSEFVEFLKEVFIDFGEIHGRKMFGGYGIYHKGVMFGLVADDTLYLKVDTDSVKEFEAKGLGPFEYNNGKKVIKMSYSLAPEEILDDPQDAAIWARRAYKVALHSKTKTKAKGEKSSRKRTQNR